MCIQKLTVLPSLFPFDSHTMSHFGVCSHLLVTARTKGSSLNLVQIKMVYANSFRLYLVVQYTPLPQTPQCCCQEITHVIHVVIDTFILNSDQKSLFKTSLVQTLSQLKLKFNSYIRYKVLCCLQRIFSKTSLRPLFLPFITDDCLLTTSKVKYELFAKIFSNTNFIVLYCILYLLLLNHCVSELNYYFPKFLSLDGSLKFQLFRGGTSCKVSQSAQ